MYLAHQAALDQTFEVPPPGLHAHVLGLGVGGQHRRQVAHAAACVGAAGQMSGHSPRPRIGEYPAPPQQAQQSPPGAPGQPRIRPGSFLVGRPRRRRLDRAPPRPPGRGRAGVGGSIRRRHATPTIKACCTCGAGACYRGPVPLDSVRTDTPQARPVRVGRRCERESASRSACHSSRGWRLRGFS